MMPKSAIVDIGENRLARKLAIVVTAASTSGTATFRSPVRIACSTGRPSVRCSR